MALTGRAALVALAGVVPIVLAPSGLTVLAWLLLLAVLVGVDLALAGSPRALRVAREPLPTVRLGEEVRAALVIGNAGRRRARGVLRDGWSPSAGDTVPRHRLDVPAGQQRRGGPPPPPAPPRGPRPPPGAGGG